MYMDQGHEQKEFNRLYKEMDELYHEIAVKTGMSDSAFFIFYAIVEMGGGCLQKTIAERYFFSRQTINSSIQNLKAKGFVSLVHGKGHDKHIYLTPAGQRFAEDKIFPVLEMENEAFSEMPAGERQTLLHLTEKYIRLLQKKAEEI